MGYKILNWQVGSTPPSLSLTPSLTATKSLHHVGPSNVSIGIPPTQPSSTRLLPGRIVPERIIQSYHVDSRLTSPLPNPNGLLLGRKRVGPRQVDSRLTSSPPSLNGSIFVRSRTRRSAANGRADSNTSGSGPRTTACRCALARLEALNHARIHAHSSILYSLFLTVRPFLTIRPLFDQLCDPNTPAWYPLTKTNAQ